VYPILAAPASLLDLTIWRYANVIVIITIIIIMIIIITIINIIGRKRHCAAAVSLRRHIVSAACVNAGIAHFEQVFDFNKFCYCCR